MSMTANALGRVLVVDDELGPRESLRMLLKPSYAIQTAENGRTALDLLRRFQPDVVIMDIKMPEMDGLELLRHVKRADPSIEVVMITAYASLETVRHALTHGAFEYLIKPFSRQDLEDVVHRAFVRRRADLGTRGQVARLVEEMRKLSAKTRELEEAEATEQSLRVTQLSILREISRTIVGHLDPQNVTAAVTEQLRAALGYDSVAIAPEIPAGVDKTDPFVVVCVIRDIQGPLGYLVIDNRSPRRASVSCSRCSPNTWRSLYGTRASTARSPTPSSGSSRPSRPPVRRSSRSRPTIASRSGIPRPSASSAAPRRRRSDARSRRCSRAATTPRRGGGWPRVRRGTSSRPRPPPGSRGRSSSR
jgi:CheY-like chemotaxis protein